MKYSNSDGVLDKYFEGDIIVVKPKEKDKLN